jgi:uncharacterized membrane protein
MVTVSFTYKRITDRGFLIGPYCPIYGFSALIMILTLDKYINDPLVLFLIVAVIASIMEYITSYIMEKLFKARWWDYSDKKFNVNGRICLENSFLFGLLGLILLYLINPFLSSLLILTNKYFLTTISSFLLVLFVIDVIISFNVIRKIKFTAEAITKDYTEEITTRVKEVLYNKSHLTKRLIEAFPNFSAISVKIKLRK